MKTLVHAPGLPPGLPNWRRGSEPVIALCCSRRRKQGEPGVSTKDAQGDLNGHPRRSFYPFRTSLASAPAQRLF
jgi:hypothetical protein